MNSRFRNEKPPFPHILGVRPQKLSFLFGNQLVAIWMILPILFTYLLPWGPPPPVVLFEEGMKEVSLLRADDRVVLYLYHARIAA